jgi:hypothetical protein
MYINANDCSQLFQMDRYTDTLIRDLIFEIGCRHDASLTDFIYQRWSAA